MPPEKEVISEIMKGSVTSVSGDEVRGFLSVVGLFIIGTMGRILATREEFDLRIFIGELLMGFVGGVVLWSFGLLQSMTFPEMLMVGGLGGLGGVRLIEWIIQIAKKVREVA